MQQQALHAVPAVLLLREAESLEQGEARELEFAAAEENRAEQSVIKRIFGRQNRGIRVVALLVDLVQQCHDFLRIPAAKLQPALEDGRQITAVHGVGVEIVDSVEKKRPKRVGRVAEQAQLVEKRLVGFAGEGEEEIGGGFDLDGIESAGIPRFGRL